ncbi:disintegrin and metalloproteinase domain-containing protein 32-like isoform X4 [Neopelma chrysocephalum]|uniref:disintegrin and metalloproteinase domain-containing protein 32-like isoform X4 n=1 Tax=Neopelma chrysocephalum TaxID=114329 RepID=UPI000FCD1C9E|nr:disintegrin and metalloproteinase domain-containing protein 32-like isoform X4 [Neopelma chrysocephalum]
MGPLCAMPPLLLLLLLELLHEAGQGPPAPSIPRLWAQPWGSLSPLGWQVPSQVTIPQRLPANVSRATRLQQDTVSYVLRIEGRPYTIHLQQHAFLSDDFQIHVSDEEGSLPPDSAHMEGGCHYWGYIDGFPSSAVTLSTCSGLRGLLQFENVSYGIEPLDDSPAFEHLVYRVSEEDTAGPSLAHSPPGTGLGGLVAEETSTKAHGGDELPSAAARSPKYLAVHVVLDRALYNYMGSDPNAVTQKIIQAFNLVNNMFNPLNVTIVLSSLELWAEGDKIPTAGDTDDLLQRFLRWKQLTLALQAHDIALLLGYRDQGAPAGTAALGKACQRDAAAAVALCHGKATLESFSVLLAQVLGRSLGMSSDSPRACGCSGRVCTMSPAALHFSGAKAFSNCSVRDFETFLKQGRGVCLFSRPRLRPLSPRSGAVCGNGVVEPGEQCDCGAPQQCLHDNCCTWRCQLMPKAKCASGPCCKNCQFRKKNSLCRPISDSQCDLPEFCSGSSGSCPPDVYVQDGQSCERGTGYCYQGRCQSLDLQCQRLYGKDSKSAPVACYEEINSQRDRNLRCGKLVCTYPSSNPFPSAAAAVIYARVRKHLCVSMSYLNASALLDPLLVPPGTKCGSERVCINNTCHPRSVLGSRCDSQVMCHGHGVCNNKGNCHCYRGWKPPSCQIRGSGGSVDSGFQLVEGGLPLQRALEHGELAWLVLGSSLALLILASVVVLGLILWQQELLGWCHGQQPRGTEGSPHRASQDMDRELEPDPELNLEPDAQLDPELQTDRELDPELKADVGPALELKQHHGH